MVLLSTILTLALLFYVAFTLLGFLKNLRAARATKLQCISRPIYEYNFVYMVTEPWREWLIPKLGRWSYLDFYKKDWRMHVRFEKHKALGDVYCMASPAYLQIEVANADASLEIASRTRSDFLKPIWQYGVMRVFGDNLITVDEKAWRRHRKAIASSFNDSIHANVWSQSLQLARQMQTKWRGKASVGDSMRGQDELGDLISLAVRVVVAASFGISVQFSSASTEITKETRGKIDAARVNTFANSLVAITKNVVPVLLFPRRVLRWGPREWRHLATASDDIENFFDDAINYEREKQAAEAEGLSKLSTPRDSVLRGVVSALTTNPPDLSTQDAHGNLFTLAIAGSETTADTLYFSFVNLALDQELQNWVLEELDNVLDIISKDPGDWNYEAVHPRLIRVLCVMMEVLRLFPPVVTIPKWTDEKETTLYYDGTTRPLPPRTLIHWNVAGTHVNPKYWGEDADKFRPQCWDKRHPKTWPGSTPNADHIPLREPIAGAFVPFSMGNRSCVGRKFAEAEYVAVFAILFRNHRVELDFPSDSTLQEAEERAREALEQSRSYMTLQIGHKVPLKWTPRRLDVS